MLSLWFLDRFYIFWRENLTILQNFLKLKRWFLKRNAWNSAWYPIYFSCLCHLLQNQQRRTPTKIIFFSTYLFKRKEQSVSGHFRLEGFSQAQSRNRRNNITCSIYCLLKFKIHAYYILTLLMHQKSRFSTQEINISIAH